MKRMRPAAAAIIALIMCAGISVGKDLDPATKRKIATIENGLVIFDPGARGGQPPQRATLAERMAHYKIPGVSMALINGDEMEWARSYGTLKAESGVPVKTDSLFQAASTTKMLVAAVALRLVEKGN